MQYSLETDYYTHIYIDNLKKTLLSLKVDTFTEKKNELVINPGVSYKQVVCRRN